MKRRMLKQFRTQGQTIANLRLPACERFRPAPSYDFAAVPNGGRVFYDHFDWGLASRDWCLYARSALEELRLPATQCL
jgi:hypothetical protein